MNGDIGAAWLLNPLVTAVLLGALAITVIRLAAGRQVVLRLSRRGWRLLAPALVILVAANWLYVLWIDAH